MLASMVDSPPSHTCPWGLSHDPWGHGCSLLSGWPDSCKNLATFRLCNGLILSKVDLSTAATVKPSIMPHLSPFFFLKMLPNLLASSGQILSKVHVQITPQTQPRIERVPARSWPAHGRPRFHELLGEGVGGVRHSVHEQKSNRSLQRRSERQFRNAATDHPDGNGNSWVECPSFAGLGYKARLRGCNLSISQFG